MIDVKYQVVVLGPGAATHSATLIRTLRHHIAELGHELLEFVAFLDASSYSALKANAPVVAIYFGGEAHSTEDLSAIENLAGMSAVILPVVSDLKLFTKLTPGALHSVNGLAPGAHDTELEEVANLVLENLGLLRKARRLFISYKRDESSRAALQLKHALEARGYDVFLDTHSVPKGDPFQEVLKQRLADSDVMLLLDTPNFMASQWTAEELAEAQNMTVGILQAIWPTCGRRAAYAELAVPLYLDDREVLEVEDDKGHLIRDGLSDVGLTRIVCDVERVRARSVAARHANLVREFCDAARSIGIDTVVQPDRWILARIGDRKVAVVPTIGVPDALRYHEASERFPASGEHADEALLVYDHRGVRSTWSKFLDWLDDFLPVKTVRVTSVAERLSR